MSFDFFQEQRFQVLKKMVVASTFLLTVFAVINLVNGVYALFIPELLLSVIGVIAIWKFDCLVTSNTIEKFSLVFTNILLTFLMVVLAKPGITITAFLWVIVIPHVAYSFTGMKQGLALSSIYVIISTSILIIRLHLDSSSLQIEPIANIVLSVIASWVLAHLYGRSNSINTAKLVDLASHDQLTGLDNRHYLYQYFNKRQGSNITFLLIDLDFFKNVNDTYGHDAGDYVLQEVAKIFVNTLPKNARVFRLGGEEFAVVVNDFSNEQTVTLAESILTRLRNKTIRYRSDKIRVTASIGIASANEGFDFNEIMRQADKFLYQAKQNGRDRVEHGF